jgi:2',3'-cyclic-nucleotide 2'-phosphodiesterase (5'-nucleotidase family)
MSSFLFFKNIVLCTLSIAMLFFIDSRAQSDTGVSLIAPVQPFIAPDTAVTIRILCTGDIMTHMPVVNASRVSTAKKYDFLPSFELIAPYLQSSDLTIGNLETVLAGDKHGISGYPNFNAPQVLANDLKESGFDLLTTCNNHSFDKGLKGLKNTLSHIDSLGFLYTGTFADSAPVKRHIMTEIKGCKIGILAYAYGINGTLSSRLSRYINIIDTANILQEIDTLKANNADIIIAVMHFGIEYQMNPSAEQKSLVQFLWRNGVQIVIGHHPHVLQPALFDTVNNRFAVFSLGNFYSAQKGKNKDFGGIADITLKKMPGDSLFKIADAHVVISGVVAWTDSSKLRYTILPLDSAVIQSLPSHYPSNWISKLDTLPFFTKHMNSMNGAFCYDTSEEQNPPDSSR